MNRKTIAVVMMSLVLLAGLGAGNERWNRALAAGTASGTAAQRTALARVKAAVAGFHAKYNAGNCAAIYLDTDGRFKLHVSMAEMLKMCDNLHQKLGAQKSSVLERWAVSNKPTADGTVVALLYLSKFEDGDAAETFFYLLAPDGPTLVHYSVSPIKSPK